jgi:hypothetical protein
MTNPFDQAVAVMKAAGVPDAVFTRAEQLLRIPQDKQRVQTGKLEVSVV